MTEAETDLVYFMRRAREEAHSALKADKPEVAAAHHGLSVRYSAKALLAHIEREDAPAFPQLSQPRQRQ